ncbi:MAG: tRNA (adenosine(37)-N6)-dimethylallyltransferase MiaA [Clostridia bacterium]|nr:tRNA (adenosine(37)-N6)-dimethylallyltransferase MiaA [Clostridia bacterium]
MKNRMVIFVVGPTATGKTELAVDLGIRFDSEVISADSMQIYKGMHIASAAPEEEEKRGVKHNLIEFLPYNASFTVADYAEAARKEINRILNAGKTPIVAGGTGLYINALADNVNFLPIKTDTALRESLSREYDRIGGEAMLGRLRTLDSAAAEKLSAADKRRIVRAFEIYETSGITKTEQNARSLLSPPDFTPVMIGITFNDRQALYERINRRVDKMLETGLLDEARIAYESFASGGAVQAIGHKEFFPFFEGKQTFEEAVETLKRATRRYAKRQLTWFNRDSRINWIYRDNTPDVFAKAIKIIETEEKKNA